MSRRITIFVLAASTTLIATHTCAECLGTSCRGMTVTDRPAAQAAAHEPVRPVQYRKVAQNAEPPQDQPHRIREQEPRSRPAGYGQTEITPEASGAYVVPDPLFTGSVIAAVPGLIYPYYAAVPIYMVAPNARIISIDRRD